MRLTGAAIATGGLALMGVGTVGAPAISNGTVLQASGGDNNAGDFFLDSISLGPGGETDPHLGCPTDIIVGGMNLADTSGTFVIFGWPPSGHQEPVYHSTWSYTVSTGTTTIAVIPTATLIANAVAAGDTPQNGQGYHFWFQLLQDPFKHKTFWLNCVATTTSSTTSSTPSTTTTTTTTPVIPPVTTTTTTTPETPTTTTTTTTTPETITPGTTTTTPTPETTSGTTIVPPPTTIAGSSGETTPVAGTNVVGSAGGVGGGSGVLGVSTGTPSTGADVEFGLGLGLLIGGTAVALGSGRLFRRKK